MNNQRIEGVHKEELDLSNKKEGFDFKEALRQMGPAIIIASGIIGPGTVTTASVYGSMYGYAGLFLVLIAGLLAYFYQEPAIRVVNKEDGSTILSGIRENIGKGWALVIWIALVFGAIMLQAGNISGAALALSYFFPNTTLLFWCVIISLCGGLLGWIGRYSLIENFNKIVIIAITVCFVICAIYSSPNPGELIQSGLKPQIAGGDYWNALALISTTAPYHVVIGYSCLMAKKNSERKGKTKIDNDNSIKQSKLDLLISTVVAGLVTTAIVICAGSVLFPRGIVVKSAADMAFQLTPILGKFAGVVFSLGLFSASISTVLYQITMQPYYINELLGLEVDLKSKLSRIFMVIVCIVPILAVALFGGTPVTLIIAAQAITGLAYPLVVVLVWKLCNDENFMGKYKNTKFNNIIYGMVFVVTTFLTIKTFMAIIENL